MRLPAPGPVAAASQADVLDPSCRYVTFARRLWRHLCELSPAVYLRKICAEVATSASPVPELYPRDAGSLTVAAALRDTHVDGGELGARVDSFTL